MAASEDYEAAVAMFSSLSETERIKLQQIMTDIERRLSALE